MVVDESGIRSKSGGPCTQKVAWWCQRTHLRKKYSIAILRDRAAHYHYLRTTAPRSSNQVDWWLIEHPRVMAIWSHFFFYLTVNTHHFFLNKKAQPATCYILVSDLSPKVLSWTEPDIDRRINRTPAPDIWTGLFTIQTIIDWLIRDISILIHKNQRVICTPLNLRCRSGVPSFCFVWVMKNKSMKAWRHPLAPLLWILADT